MACAYVIGRSAHVATCNIYWRVAAYRGWRVAAYTACMAKRVVAECIAGCKRKREREGEGERDEVCIPSLDTQTDGGNAFPLSTRDTVYRITPCVDIYICMPIYVYMYRHV